MQEIKGNNNFKEVKNFFIWVLNCHQMEKSKLKLQRVSKWGILPYVRDIIWNCKT
jgi:hypothetical protein